MAWASRRRYYTEKNGRVSFTFYVKLTRAVFSHYNPACLWRTCCRPARPSRTSCSWDSSGCRPPGRKSAPIPFTTSIGGGAPITAVAAARLGLRVSLASGLSDAAARRLRAERVRVINLRRAGEPHAVSAALSTTGERAFVTFDGVNTHLEPRLARAVAHRRRPRRTSILRSIRATAAAWAGRVRRLRRRGATTSWDFGWNDVLARDPESAGTRLTRSTSCS